MNRRHILVINTQTLSFTAWSVERVAKQRLNIPTPNGNRVLLYLYHPEKGGKWHSRSSITVSRLSLLLHRGWQGYLIQVSKQWGTHKEAHWLAEVWKEGFALENRRLTLSTMSRREQFLQAQNYAQLLDNLALPRVNSKWLREKSASKSVADTPKALAPVPNDSTK